MAVLVRRDYLAERERKRPPGVEAWQYQFYLGLLAYSQGLSDDALRHFAVARRDAPKEAQQLCDYNVSLCQAALGHPGDSYHTAQSAGLTSESGLEALGVSPKDAVLFLARLKTSSSYIPPDGGQSAAHDTSEQVGSDGDDAESSADRILRLLGRLDEEGVLHRAMLLRALNRCDDATPVCESDQEPVQKESPNCCIDALTGWRLRCLPCVGAHLAAGCRGLTIFDQIIIESRAAIERLQAQIQEISDRYRQARADRAASGRGAGGGNPPWAAPERSPIVAGILSILIPGAGQLYKGERAKVAGIWLTALGASFIGGRLERQGGFGVALSWLLIAVWVIVWIWQIRDAFRPRIP